MSDATGAVLPPLCIFHRNCLDGRASAAVVRRRFPEAECRPHQYGWAAPEVLGRAVYIVDFAFPVETMRLLAQRATVLHWFDHHATSRDLRAQLGWGVYDEDECGSTLAWRELFPGQPLPEVLRYVRDKDLWQWRLPDSRAIVAGLERAFDDKDFAGLLDADLARLAVSGRKALARIDERVAKILRRGIAVREPYGLRGVRALALNAGTYLSEIGEKVCAAERDGGMGLDLAIMFTMRADGKWIHSLRSASVDCERIARNRGGGGHKAAASYVADEPFTLGADCLG